MPKKTDITAPLPAVERSAKGLRDAIFDEIDGLRAGTITPSHARAVANLVRQCIDAARLDLQSRRSMPNTLMLGDDSPLPTAARDTHPASAVSNQPSSERNP